MKEMLVQQKAELQKRDKKGFTLMEMLIVVAIIAVLVAIAIPVFMGQLDKAKAQTDAANIRSGYASAMAHVLSDNPTATASSKVTYTLQEDASVTSTNYTPTPAFPTGTAYACQGDSSNLSDETIGGQKVGTGTGEIKWDDKDEISYEWDGSKMTIKVTAK